MNLSTGEDLVYGVVLCSFGLAERLPVTSPESSFAMDIHEKTVTKSHEIKKIYIVNDV